MTVPLTNSKIGCFPFSLLILQAWTGHTRARKTTESRPIFLGAHILPCNEKKKAIRTSIFESDR